MSRHAALQRDERLDAVFHALADSTRRHMMERLSHGCASVTELAEPFPMSLAAISKHLDVLENAGIVRRERDGRFQRCHLTPDALDGAGGFIEHYRSFWNSTLDQLAEYLESDGGRGSPRRTKEARQTPVSSTIALVVRRTVKASVARVFEAWTQPEQLRRWWGPRPVTCSGAEIDLRVGGGYRIGNLLPDGTTVWISGEFEVIEPPQRLVYTWLVEGKPAAAPEHSRVTVRFEPRADGTEIIVVHERIDSEETRADHQHGWNGCLDNLEALFAEA